VHQRLAALFEARKEYPKLVRERRAIIALVPADKAEAYYQLAVAYRASNDDANAKKSVLRSLEEAPNFVKAQELLLSIVDGKKP
jgi:Tfp pilus assembly protein PilF